MHLCLSRPRPYDFESKLHSAALLFVIEPHSAPAFVFHQAAVRNSLIVLQPVYNPVCVFETHSSGIRAAKRQLFGFEPPSSTLEFVWRAVQILDSNSFRILPRSTPLKLPRL